MGYFVVPDAISCFYTQKSHWEKKIINKILTAFIHCNRKFILNHEWISQIVFFSSKFEFCVDIITEANKRFLSCSAQPDCVVKSTSELIKVWYKFEELRFVNFGLPVVIKPSDLYNHSITPLWNVINLGWPACTESSYFRPNVFTPY